MFKRKMLSSIKESLKHFPVTAILGPRQCGKTTLAKTLINANTIYLDLELTSDIYKLHEPEYYLKQHQDKLVIIDEIQKKPELFSLIRSLVDQKRTPGRFLILGSASPSLIKGASQSLAGRISFHELTPLLFSELKSNKDLINKHWIRGGFPDSFLAITDKSSNVWRENFIRTFLERDIPMLGINIPSTRLRKFWVMLSHYQGQLFNASQISASLGVSSTTVARYLDILTDTYVVRQLQPWFVNQKKRLVKSPKIYIRDSGLFHTLQNIGHMEGLMSNPLLGSSWEAYCIEQIINTLPLNINPFFYRTATGNELDLVLDLPNSRSPIAIEIKFSLTPKLSKGFYIALDDIGASRAYVIYPGAEVISLANNITILPLNIFLEQSMRNRLYHQ